MNLPAGSGAINNDISREETPKAPDRVALESWMVTRIAEMLNVPPDEIDAGAPFTSYGLESLDAFTLAGDLASWLNRELSATLLWEHADIEALAAFLCEGTQTSWKSLTAIQPEGSRLPLFCVHAIGGSVLCYHDLARHLGKEQPFYGFQAPLADPAATPSSSQTIPEMASGYIRELRAFQAQGPYLLGGLSFGGIVAFEMARQLQQDGCEVRLVALFDSLCPGHALPLSLRRRLFFHGRRLMRLKLREKLPYLTARVRGRVGAVRSSSARQLWKVTNQAAGKIGHDLPHAFRHAHIVNDLAARTYVAPPYNGQVTLFRAKDRLGVADDPQNGWQHVAQGGVEVHDVPGDHFSLIDEPNVQVLASCLTGWLERMQGREV